MSSPRIILIHTWVVVLLSSGCGDKSDDSEADEGSATTATGSATTGPTGSATTEPTGAATTTSTGETTAGIVDTCPGRPGGDWNACSVDGVTDNALCNFTMGDGAGTPLCLSPTSGAFNVCGIRDCVDDCDCFAPPKTGTAIPLCNVVFGNGGRGCVLYCVNGQICPDGMECVSGTCYWPS
jgi:hypothetical protein